MEIATGTHLGPYEILSVLGSGGMGKVYRARDNRLGREVAVKISDEQFSDLFEHEARLIASLNHPHICRIYDVGPNYLVMELIEGSRLRGPLPLEKALLYADQILDALAAAHHKRIVHRDLKPANILTTRDGIKLLDFGIAFLNSAAAENTEETLTATLLGASSVTGTIQYMSPEQLSGRPVDTRSDLFSFGCVLYEMLSGERPFQSQSSAEAIAAILTKEPDPLKIPAAIHRVMQRALAKDPDDRYQTARDLKAALLWAAEPVPAPGAPRPAKRPWLWQIAAVTALAAASGLAALWFFRPAPGRIPVTFTLEPPPGGAFNYMITGGAISPDGRFIIFRAADQGGAPLLWVRALDSLVARRLPGTDGGDYPFWSPDGNSIAFFAGGKLNRLDNLAGVPIILCDADAANAVAGGTWSRSGTILFADRRGLLTIPSTGGTPSLLRKTQPAHDEGPFGYPQFLPDDVHYLYFRQSSDTARQGIYAGSLAAPQQSKQILSTLSKAVYTPPISGHPGQLLYLKGHSLAAQPFDASDLRLRAQPVVIADNITVLPALRAAAFWVSETGTLLYRSGLAAGTDKLTWVSREGKSRTEAAVSASYSLFRLSPDGKRAVVGRQDVTDFTDLSDLWILDFERKSTTRFTFGPEWNSCPVWSPDGSQIAFVAHSAGAFRLYRRDAQGNGAAIVLPASDAEIKCPMDWSRDGRFLLYAQGNGGVFDLWALPVAQPGKPFLVVGPPFDKPDAQFSPDMRWVAYTSNQSGRYEVYVRPFPASAGAEAKWQVSNDGGRAPRWRADGKELYYLSLDNQIKAVKIQLPLNGPAPTEAPQELFAADIPGNLGENIYPYDVTPDGRRFLVEEFSGVKDSSPPTVLVNWQAVLGK